MERKEYLLAELPEEWYGSNVESMVRSCIGFDSHAMSAFGVTLNGVRYRVYRDARVKARFKVYADLMDALCGADVPMEDVRDAMDAMRLDPAAQDEIWSEIETARRVRS